MSIFVRGKLWLSVSWPSCSSKCSIVLFPSRLPEWYLALKGLSLAVVYLSCLNEHVALFKMILSSCKCYYTCLIRITKKTAEEQKTNVLLALHSKYGVTCVNIMFIWMFLSICLNHLVFHWLRVCACVFWVRSQCFSIYDLVTIALDILSLLQKLLTSTSTHTSTNTHKHPTTLVNDLRWIKFTWLQFQSSDAASRMPSSHFSVYSFWQLLQVTHTLLTE